MTGSIDQLDLYPRGVRPVRLPHPPLTPMASPVNHPQAQEVGR